ncbi:MAG: hypothetical protein WBB45_05100 [Cyclobacteriaceae bacterium]
MDQTVGGRGMVPVGFGSGPFLQGADVTIAVVGNLIACPDACIVRIQVAAVICGL